MPAYYSENDPKAAAWLRELIKAGHIAPGDVDERSIEDVTPMDVAGYTQCHFFAGIGGWSYALRLAGWSDSRSVWTGSCPCQPFSAAGKGAGFADERHLWPAWFHLIRGCAPPVIFGEQVANALAWFDLVSGDLENEAYAVGGAIIGAHSVGAPHIRQRLYWVADCSGARLHADFAQQQPQTLHGTRQKQSERRGAVSELAESQSEQRHGHGHARSGRRESADGCELGDASSAGSGRDGGTVLGKKEIERALRCLANEPESAGELGNPDAQRLLLLPERDSQSLAGPISPCWADAGGPSFVDCRDGKSRPVEPGTFPLAHGIPGRVGLLRGYGNAIVPQCAAAFISAYTGTTE